MESQQSIGVPVTLQRVAHRFYREGSKPLLVLSDVSHEIPASRFVCVVGPTGCGKSTILNLVSGLYEASAGLVAVGNGMRRDQIDSAYLFQSDTLLPWRTAMDNVCIPLQIRGKPKRDARVEAKQWLERVGLAGFETYYPARMSGGMRKRTALAQALIHSPQLLLMDEPFAALDAQTRLKMQDLLLHLWDRSGQTVIFVTHDLEEAIALADEVVVMSAGPESTIKGVFPVALERPRDIEELRLSGDYRTIYRSIWDCLASEIKRVPGVGSGL